MSLNAHLIQSGGGTIVITSSSAGLAGMMEGSPGIAAYTASKHGVVGLMRGYAKLLGQHNIRVNTVHPTAVNTPMITSEEFLTHIKESPGMTEVHKVLPISAIESQDVSDAIAWLVSDEARYVTGVTLPVDAGTTLA
jgi:NAD(P)-dependent dehydrogenase (short-subunit alcohol dehydrogenase family)